MGFAQLMGLCVCADAFHTCALEKPVRSGDSTKGKLGRMMRFTDPQAAS